MAGNTPSHRGRNIAIIVGISVVLLGGAMCGGLMWAVGSGTGSEGNGNRPETISTNTPVSGEIDYSHDHRVYEFTLTQAGAVSVAVVSDFDNYLELYREGEETAFTQDDDSGGNLNALINTTLTPGTYYALVRPFSGGETGDYTITVTALAEPEFAGGHGATPPVGGGTPPVGGGTPPPVGGTSPPYAPSGTEIVTQTHRGVASSVSGPAPVTAGTQCNVVIMGAQTRGGHNCRVQVTCNGNTIYGRDAGNTRYGYVQCTARNTSTGTQLLQAVDNGPTSSGGDPMINLDTGSNSISVSDDTRGGLWNVTIQFVGAAPTAPQTAI